MKRKSVSAMAGIVVLFALVIHGSSQSRASQQPPWLEPYAPTRLEWLALTMYVTVPAETEGPRFVSHSSFPSRASSATNCPSRPPANGLAISRAEASVFCEPREPLSGANAPEAASAASHG